MMARNLGQPTDTQIIYREFGVPHPSNALTH